MINISTVLSERGRTSVSASLGAKIPLNDTTNFGTGKWDVGGSLSLSHGVSTNVLLGFDFSYWHFGDLPELDLRDGLMGLKERHPVIGDVRGVGLFAGLGVLCKPGFVPLILAPGLLYLAYNLRAGGQWKNLLLAASGRMDAHFTALWEGGHIKFFSRATLRALLEETGFRVLDLARVGRLPPIARSMVVSARRPAG